MEANGWANSPIVGVFLECANCVKASARLPLISPCFSDFFEMSDVATILADVHTKVVTRPMHSKALKRVIYGTPVGGPGQVRVIVALLTVYPLAAHV